jgi:hypothetical protein
MNVSATAHSVATDDLGTGPPGSRRGTARALPFEFNRANAERGAAGPYCCAPVLAAGLLAAPDRALGSDA